MSYQNKKTLKDLHLTERFLFAEAMEIHNRLERIRSNEEVGVRWMQEWEEKLKIKKEAKKEGMEEGLLKGMEALIITSFELGASDDVVISKLMELFNLTEEGARERISQYRKNC